MMKPSFSEWLESPLGAEIYHRITHNRHSVPLILYQTRWQTTEDVQQDALICLMLNYEKHGFTKILAAARDDDHAASMITRYCIQRSHNKYCRRQKREELIDDDKLEILLTGSRVTNGDVHGTEAIDLRIDLEWAKQQAVQTLEADKTLRNRGKIAHRTQVFCEAHMYYANGAHGTMEEFCKSQQVSKRTINHWKPRIMSEFRSELASYRQ